MDYVSEEAEIAGRAAALYALGQLPEAQETTVTLKAGNGVRYVLPQSVKYGEPFDLYLRVTEPKENVVLHIGDKQVRRRTVKPSEMLKIPIRENDLQAWQGQTEITVEMTAATSQKKGGRLTMTDKVLTKTCIVCPIGCELSITIDENNEFVSVSGNQCRRGEDYAVNEINNPQRVITTTVAIDSKELRLLPVRTKEAILRT